VQREQQVRMHTPIVDDTVSPVITDLHEINLFRGLEDPVVVCHAKDGGGDVPSVRKGFANLDPKAVMRPPQGDTVVGDGKAELRSHFSLSVWPPVQEGDTELHEAGFSDDPEVARDLPTRRAQIQARNRRAVEPLHAAVIGVPGPPYWNPIRQRDVKCLSRRRTG
jgi:hypothetical protein